MNTINNKHFMKTNKLVNLIFCVFVNSIKKQFQLSQSKNASPAEAIRCYRKLAIKRMFFKSYILALEYTIKLEELWICCLNLFTMITT